MHFAAGIPVNKYLKHFSLTVKRLEHFSLTVNG